MFNLRLLFCTFLCLRASGVFANILLRGANFTLSFEDMEANFTPPVNASGECGTIFLAEPLDACSPLTNNLTEDSINSPYVLIIRGICSFEDKVRRAQSAGFKAAIVYNNDESDLVAMAGNPAGIKIHAVFVSRASGLKMTKYVGLASTQVWLVHSGESSAWSIMAISFISILAMSAVLATCFFVRRHRIRRERPQGSSVRTFHGMSSRLVKAMPSLIFTAVLEDNCTSATCAICLEDYNVGDKLRILPCRHKFHTICVDAWLTSWRTFCPVCKRDARNNTGDPAASERTPLLSSSSISISVASSSYTSSAIQIGRSSPTLSDLHSLSATPYNQPSLQSFRQSSYLSPTHSSLDMRNASSSFRSQASHFVSSNSLGYPLSPQSSRYLSLYYSSPRNAIWSSSRQPRPLRQSQSASSFSPYASAQSLPEC